jgi:hypothetical protein
VTRLELQIRNRTADEAKSGSGHQAEGNLGGRIRAALGSQLSGLDPKL